MAVLKIVQGSRPYSSPRVAFTAEEAQQLLAVAGDWEKIDGHPRQVWINDSYIGAYIAADPAPIGDDLLQVYLYKLPGPKTGFFSRPKPLVRVLAQADKPVSWTFKSFENMMQYTPKVSWAQVWGWPENLLTNLSPGATQNSS